MTGKLVGATPRNEGVDWKRFLTTGSPREVLARLVDGDPLGVRTLIAERLDGSRRLLDAERVALRTLARVARFACRYRGRPDFRTWLVERCDEAILDILDEEREAVGNPGELASEPSEAFTLLAEPLGLEAHTARRACVIVNDCTIEERTAFFALVLEARPLDEVADDTNCEPTILARRARFVLLALLRPEVRNLEVLP